MEMMYNCRCADWRLMGALEAKHAERWRIIMRMRVDKSADQIDQLMHGKGHLCVLCSELQGREAGSISEAEVLLASWDCSS